MPSFGIISEGVTDQIVIRNILDGCFEDVFVAPVQPPVPSPGESSPPGGWSLIFKSLEQRDHVEAISRNDYLVIHIDTDVSEQKGYDVPWREGDTQLSVEMLVMNVRNKIISAIGHEFYANHSNQFIFAIAVHSIECWLLPLYHTDSHASKIAGCLDAANRAIANKDIRLTRGQDGEGKDPQAYRAASRAFTKRKELLRVRDKNPSLAIFINQLDVIAQATVPTVPAASVEPAAPDVQAARDSEK